MLNKTTWFGRANLLVAALRYKYQIVFGALLAMVVTLLVSGLTVPEYVASTSFMLQSAPQEIASAQQAPQGNRQRADRLETVTTAIEILNSVNLKEQVIKALGPEMLYPELGQGTASGLSSTARNTLDNILRLLGLSPTLKTTATPVERARQRFEQALSVDPEENSSVIRLYFRHDNAEKAINVLKVYLSLFARNYLELYDTTDVSLMIEKLIAYQRALDEAEGAIQAVNEQYGLFDSDEQVTLLLNRSDRLDAAADRIDTDIKKKQQEISSLKEALQQLPRKVILYTDVQETTDSEEIIVQPHERYGNKMVRTGRNSAYDELNLEIQRLDADLRGLLAARDEIAVQRERMARELPKIAEGKMKLHRLDRELRVRERGYETHLAKLEEARTQERLNRKRISNIGVIQPPTARLAPLLGLSMTIKLLIAGLLGFVGSLLVAVIYAYRRRELAAQNSVEERFAVPVLATLPEKMIGRQARSGH